MTDTRIYIQTNRKRPTLSTTISEENLFQDLQHLNNLLKLEPKQINIQSNCYNKAIKKFINKAINCGCVINFEIEKHNYIFNCVDNLKPIFWRYKAFEEIKGFLEIEQADNDDYLKELELFQKIEYRKRVTGDKIEITQEMINLLKKYGQAYGIDTSYISKLENPEPDTPTQYKAFYYKTLNGNTAPNEQQQKMIFIKQKAKKAFVDKKRILDDYNQIKWYIANNIHYDEGWKNCPVCGTPAKNGFCRLCDEQEPEQITYKEQFIINKLFK